MKWLGVVEVIAGFTSLYYGWQHLGITTILGAIAVIGGAVVTIIGLEHLFKGRSDIAKKLG